MTINRWDELLVEALGHIKSAMNGIKEIARLAEEIHSKSDDPDVRQWAWDIILLSDPPAEDV